MESIEGATSREDCRAMCGDVQVIFQTDDGRRVPARARIECDEYEYPILHDVQVGSYTFPHTIQCGDTTKYVVPDVGKGSIECYR